MNAKQDTRTIVVENSFGREVEITKVEFIKRWTSHVSQLKGLSYGYWDEFDKMEKRVAEIAAEEFENCYK